MIIEDMFSFRPVDTLFFRGSEPMIMGESHDSNFNFPPPVHTIEGAVRTLLYFKDRDKYADLIKVGKKKGGFNIIGPMFSVNGEIFIPAPYSWYEEDSKKSCGYDESVKHKEIKEGTERMFKFNDALQYIEKVKIFKSDILKDEADLIKTGADKIYWVKADNFELISIGGNWINIDALNGDSDKIRVFPVSRFFNTEPRTGIALKENRTVRKSHIYTFTHARLLEDVEIVFGVDRNMPLDDEEILKLGAEQRFGRLKRLDNFKDLKEKLNLDNKDGGYMSLSIVEGGQDLEADKHIIATGRIQYLGGWDLHRGFHKDMVGYYSAGTVFDKKFCGGLVSI